MKATFLKVESKKLYPSASLLVRVKAFELGSSNRIFALEFDLEENNKRVPILSINSVCTDDGPGRQGRLDHLQQSSGTRRSKDTFSVKIGDLALCIVL